MTEILKWEDTIIEKDERAICPECCAETSIECGEFEHSVICTACGWNDDMLEK